MFGCAENEYIVCMYLKFLNNRKCKRPCSLHKNPMGLEFGLSPEKITCVANASLSVN